MRRYGSLSHLGREAKVERTIDAKTFEVVGGSDEMRGAKDDIAIGDDEGTSRLALQAVKRRVALT